MDLERHLETLTKTKDKGIYITYINCMFELFVETYRIKCNFPPNKIIGTSQAFKGLGAKEIDSKYKIELGAFKEVRNDLTHSTFKMKEHLKDMKEMEDEFIIFINKYSPLLEITTDHLDYLLEPFNQPTEPNEDASDLDWFK